MTQTEDAISQEKNRLLPAIYGTGPLLTALAVLAAHAVNSVLRPSDYASAPPSISRIIVHPEIGYPFSLVMLVTALSIFLPVVHFLLAGWKAFAAVKWARGAIVLFSFSAFAGTAGIVILTQYRTAEVQGMHDFGSYLLFFGFAFCITILGVILSKTDIDRRPPHAAALTGLRRAAFSICFAAIVYGIGYFGGKQVPDTYFFAQRLFMMIYEVALILAFVWFLWRLKGFALSVQQVTLSTRRSEPALISFRLLIDMVAFLWKHLPIAPKTALIVLALLSGLTRDLVMLVVNEAARSDRNETYQFWLPSFIVLLVAFVGSAYAYQVLTKSVTTKVINQVRLRLVAQIMASQPNLIQSYERGALYHIMTTDVSIVAGTTATLLALMPLGVFLMIAIPQLFLYSQLAGFLVVAVMASGVMVYAVSQQRLAALGLDARRHEVAYFEKVSEMLDGHRELRLHHGRQSAFAADLAAGLDKLRTALVAVTKSYESSEAAISVMKFALFGGIVFLVPALFEIDVNVVFSVLLLVLYCMAPFEQLVASYPSIIGSLVSFLRVEDLTRNLPAPPVDIYAPRSRPFKGMVLTGVKARHKMAGETSFSLGPITLEIQAGEIVFLVGENGSGKTTLLNVLAGLHDIESGNIRFVDETDDPPDMAGHRERVSAIFANYHVFRTNHGLAHLTDREASDAILFVNLGGHTGIIKSVFTRMELSSGQKRRLALAVALMEGRDLLILDEFLADQDETQRSFFFEVVLPALKAAGKTVILATHDLKWLSYGDRVIRMEKGRIASVRVSEKPVE